ncbi:hypothetical protein ABCH29_00465 [Chlamydia abortus]
MSLPAKISSSHSSQNQSTRFPYPSGNPQDAFPSASNNSGIKLYNSLVKQDNTTEDVVRIGAMIQDSIHRDLKKQVGGGGETSLLRIIQGIGKLRFYTIHLDF